MILHLAYIITAIILYNCYKKHKLGYKGAIMEMNSERFNILAVVLLLSILEVVCVVTLIFDIVLDFKLNINLDIWVLMLNTIFLVYYVVMNKSNILFYLRSLKKIRGKKK